jgi:hypothetical protein
MANWRSGPDASADVADNALFEGSVGGEYLS